MMHRNAMAARLAAVLVGLSLLLAPALAFAQGTGGVNAPEQREKPYVVVISFDGFRHDYIDRVETPNFDRLIARGALADGLIPVFPSKTFPNHYAIATGMYAQNHGLVDNNFWDPELGDFYTLRDREKVGDGRWYGGEPIWVTAERQGMVTAAYFFVGTEAPVAGVRPSHYRLYDGSVPNETRVEQVIEWLRMPEETRPHLIMLYFSDADDAGHRYGPDAPEVDEAVRELDRVLGLLLDGVATLPIADQVHFVLVSDHGMTGLDPEKADFLDDHVDLDGIRVFGGGPYAVLWTDGDTDRRDRIVAALNKGLRHARAYTRDEIPEEFNYKHHRRAGDILVLAEPGWQIGQSRARGPMTGGTHGWDPAAREMHGLFLAAGPRIREGVRIPAFRNVHVYPFIARILGLTPNPSVNGRLEVLAPILTPENVKATAGVGS